MMGFRVLLIKELREQERQKGEAQGE